MKLRQFPNDSNRQQVVAAMDILARCHKPPEAAVKFLQCLDRRGSQQLTVPTFPDWERMAWRAAP